MTQWDDVQTIANQVNSGNVAASDLVERALKTINEKSEYQAIISTTENRARERAKQIDEQIKEGKSAGKLAGVPFIAKDNFLTFGSETTAASNILKGFEAPYQATAIEKLEEEGAICVAKANLDAFAHGSSTENSDIMITKNPHDINRVPGGSSGGSAAAVMLDLVPFALGTDTGGSIRQPASFTGSVGLKPSYGLISRSGVVAMASSTDVVGPMARTTQDAAYVLDVLVGHDGLDSTTIDPDPKGYNIQKSEFKIHGAKIGIVKEYMGDGLAEDVRKITQNAIEKLSSAGADVIEVSLPSLPLALACYYIICPAEVSSNLSRYDGQRYGFSSKKAKSLDESYTWSRSEGFGREAKRRIMIGTYVLSSGYYDAYYKTAQRLRTKLINEFNEAFKKVDYLLGPTTPSTAFEIGANTSDPLQMYMGDILTVAANLVGIPSISIPSGFSDGLPVGLQLMAQQKQDRQLLELSKQTEEIFA